MTLASRFFGPRKSARASTARRVPGAMNKTESRYETEVLMPLTLAGTVIWYQFEALTFKLAKDCRYTPDFTVQLANGDIQCHEVKGDVKSGKARVEDDAAVKIAVAAQMFPVTFVMRWFDRSEGVWKERVY